MGAIFGIGRGHQAQFALHVEFEAQPGELGNGELAGFERLEPEVGLEKRQRHAQFEGAQR